MQNGADTLASMLNRKTSNGFMFSALLTDDGTEVFELARA